MRDMRTLSLPVTIKRTCHQVWFPTFFRVIGIDCVCACAGALTKSKYHALDVDISFACALENQV